MDFDNETIGIAGRGGHGHGSYEAVDARGMAGVHNDRQMAQFVEHGDRCKIQRVAGVIIKGADAPLTENDLLVAVCHDVFGAHQQLLQGVGKAALEQDGLTELSQLPQ